MFAYKFRRSMGSMKFPLQFTHEASVFWVTYVVLIMYSTRVLLPNLNLLTTDSMRCPSKYQQNSSQTSKEWYSTLYRKSKKPKIAKTIMYNKRTSRGITTLSSNSITELKYWKQPGISIKTDRRTNGTELKTWILIYTL